METGNSARATLKPHPIPCALMGCFLLSFLLLLAIVTCTWPLADGSGVLLTVLKLIGIAIAAGSGILALLVEFKDNTTGRITRWGQVALFGILASAVVTAGAEMVSVYKDKQNAETNLQRRQNDIERQNNQVLTLLSEIDRGVYPLTNVAISARVKLPLDDPALKKYSDKLKTEFESYDKERKTSGDRVLLPQPGQVFLGDGFTTDEPYTHKRVRVVGIPQGSPLHATAYKGSIEYQILDGIQITVKLFREPISPDSYTPQHLGCDLNLTAMGEGNLHYFPDSGPMLQSSINHIQPNQKLLRSSGAIVAIPDLVNSQMFVSLEYVFVIGDPPLGGESLRALLYKRELLSLTLHCGEQDFDFNSQDESWVRHIDKNGCPFYEITLPADMEGLRKTNPLIKLRP
jgi:hypothetical protein